MKLKNLKLHDFFTKKPIENPSDNQVWLKTYYDKSCKKFLCTRFSDINDTCLISGDKEVFVDFIF